MSSSYQDDGIGLEGTESEFEELLEQAALLTPEEAVTELLYFARFGEYDAVRAILVKHEADGIHSDDGGGSSTSALVDSTDDSDNTALHKACANGHVKTCRLLLARGASHRPNSSGNTPLHWAAANGHDEVVRLLLSVPRFKGTIDVLQKNKFGRSSLTEGFSSSNTKLVGYLLEHDSAEEERLIGGIKKEDVTNNNGGADATLNEDGSVKSSDTGSSSTACVIHEFDFHRVETNEDVLDLAQEGYGTKDYNAAAAAPTTAASEKTILIRELPIAHADDPFGAKAEDDTTGLGIWSASLVCARWMASEAVAMRLEGKCLLELGAGCGIPGLAVAFYSKAKQVLLTDLNPTTVKNMHYNIDLNKDRVEGCEPSDWCERVTAATIDWDDKSTWPTEKVDCIIGSDLIYQASIVPMLQRVIVDLLKPGGIFFYVCPNGGRDGLAEFIKVMSGKGFELVDKSVAPDVYRQNPLSSGDEEDCFLHFHELASTTYALYEFRRC